MALIDLIVTHWREPWSEGRKFFEMLKMQRGVREGDFRVILVQDGEDTGGVDLGRIARVYPFVEMTITLPHGGVSAARNEGLEYASAEWVMFCDFDDCLYAIDSMNRICTSLREAGDKADLVYSNIWIEMRKSKKNSGGSGSDGIDCEGEANDAAGGEFAKIQKGWNTVFIHGKCYRRQFLIDHGIWFSTELDYSEDAMFNSLVAMEIRPGRIARMPETVYMWCYRAESLSSYTGGESRRARSLHRKRVMLPEEYARRGRAYDAKVAAARALMEYYWEDCGGGKPAGMDDDEWRGMIAEIIGRWPGAITDISGPDRRELYRVTEQQAVGKGQKKDGMPPIWEWMAKIGALPTADEPKDNGVKITGMIRTAKEMEHGTGDPHED